MKCHARWFRTTFILLLAAVLAGEFTALAEELPRSLELSRPVRSWEFLSSTGTRAALLGNEAGRFEAWVYPLKILDDFHLRFHVRGLDLPAESLARTVVVRPESSTIIYGGDTFTVRETFFTPVKEPGAVILMEVESTEPLEVEADFRRDFQLEWPGAFGGIYSYWDPLLHAFCFEEEQKRFSAIVGSPTADQPIGEYWTNYSSSQQNSFHLGVTAHGKETKIIVIAGSSSGHKEAESTYRRLTTSYDTLLRESSAYYREYLDKTVALTLPDADLQKAYDWSRVSMAQGLVNNPVMGTGLVAGYRISADSQRPGFAWFFGRDALWTSLALNSSDDFANSRTALNFLSKYQRNDGKIPHEVSQVADFVHWFENFPYPWASADATPLFIIAVNDYVTQSGDVAFAKEKWTNLWSAYQFLRSTYDPQGLPQNAGVGHGWIEGGPLLPVKTELYQSALGAEALRALSNLARLAGKSDVSTDLSQQFERQQKLVNDSFWSSAQNTFALALDKDGKQVPVTSVLATVPMWFGLLDQPKAQAVIDQLATADHQADWGMRIISDKEPKYNPGGYHFGAVWPLFTGWASTGEYKYHRAQPAYANLRANALLGLDGSLGHITEVISGDYYQPLFGSSPHQIWSAAMVVSPLLRGLLGIEVDAPAKRLKFAPHLPADWPSLEIRKLQIGDVALNLKYERTADSIKLQSIPTGPGECALEFAPALSLRARVLNAELDGHRVSFHVLPNSIDQHVTFEIPACSKSSQLVVHLRNDFAVSLTSSLPPLGTSSRGLRIISESWTPMRDRLTLDVSGIAGNEYDLAVMNSSQISSLDGAQLLHPGRDDAKIHIQFPPGAAGDYVHRQIVFHLIEIQKH